MTELAKWAWILLLCILFLGMWTFVIIGVDIVAVVFIMWLKPEWLQKL